MYSQQNGFFPFTTKLVGIGILVYSTGTTLIEAIAKLITNHQPIDFLITLMASLAVLLFPLWIGLFLLRMFPSTRVVANGIRYSTASFLKGTIKWDEIEELLLFENDFMAVAFQRRGPSLLNGLYFNKLYGMLIHHEANVLFLSPKVSNRKEILEAIFRNTHIKSAKKVGK
jgi:hypothetical protein